MEFNKNKLINQTIDEFATTWSHTLDTGDYIDEKFLKKIDKYIYKNLKLKFKEIEIYNLLFLEEKGYKLGIFQKMKINMSGLKPLYDSEKSKKAKKAKEKVKKSKESIFRKIKKIFLKLNSIKEAKQLTQQIEATNDVKDQEKDKCRMAPTDGTLCSPLDSSQSDTIDEPPAES